MCKRLSWLLILSSLVVPFLLSCSGSTNPFTASNATISIVLENSNSQRSADSVSDTVDKIIRVGVSAFLAKYINAVTITITGSAGETDTVVTFANPGAWTDTQWIAITFHTPGTRTVSAVAVIQGEPNYSATAKIVIAGKPRTVSYNGNGNTGGTVPTDSGTYLQGASVIVKANLGSLVRTGYTFAGWNTAADGSGASYAGGETFTMGASNAILYAKWTQNPTYTVTYNGNGNTGGTVPTDANAYEQGANVTVIGNTGSLARTSFTFAGWNTAADGSGASYAGGETFTMGATNVILYAKWTQNPTYSVTYNGNGNTGGLVPTDANAYEQGASVTVKANTGNLTKTGFTFAGWNTAADGSGTSHAGGETFNIGNANVTLYANWTQNPTYTVTYNGNGNTSGGVPTDANAYEQGASVTAKTNTQNLGKTGFTFAGWNTAADGSGTSYAAGGTFNIGAGNVTLYAKWTQNPTYTVTYDGNGNTAGTAPIDANAYEQNATVTVRANTGNLAKTGFTFAGWNTAADGSGTSYAAGATLTMGIASITLYAKWTTGIYTVKFNSNGGSAVDSQNVAYNATATAPTPPTQSGFIFAGWYSDQALTIQFNFLTPITSSITLYAKWTPVYTVTYNGNGNTAGSVPVDPNKYTNGTTVTVLDNTGNLARTGYTFGGWNTNAAGTGTDRIPGATFAMGSVNITLCAKWTINQYTVSFNSNGGSSVASQSVNYSSTAATPAAPTRRSYVLAGWYSDSLLTNAFSFSTPITAAVTLYAKWVIQDADGNTYTEVTIGTQVWMVENLKTTKYNDGTGIPLVADSAAWANLSTPGYCWFADSITYKDPYGAMYNWYSINTGRLAPAGWHVATDDEWNTLILYLGGLDSSAGKLKESGTSHWSPPNTNATNSSGFTGLPGSLRYGFGPFTRPLGIWGEWWTATEDPGVTTDAWYRGLGDNSPLWDRYHFGKGYGASIRCIRDN
jgi:uncharacterized protein (TIGR02145 family)/uncharacterized repeat protein (TIGR02543 family)